MSGNLRWSQELRDYVQQLWQAGNSAEAIAKILNAHPKWKSYTSFNKNKVIGQIHRSGFNLLPRKGSTSFLDKKKPDQTDRVELPQTAWQKM